MPPTLSDNSAGQPLTDEPASSATPPFSIPEDLEEAKATARSLARAGRFDEALLCWQKVEERDPFDAEPGRMIPALTLKKNRQVDTKNADDKPPSNTANQASGSATGEPSAPQSVLPSSVPPKAPRQLVLTRRQQLEQEIAYRPQEESNYLALAELHLAERRTYEAQRTLTRALEVSRDIRIVERLEDVNMLRAREQLSLAEDQATALKTQEAGDLVEKARQECYQLELDVYRNRCFRHPEDKRLKYQLGLRLKQIGNHREALESLQAGLEFPELRAAASLEIGEILQRHHQFPKALQCYRQSAQLAAGDDGLDILDLRKRALYRAGVLATAMTLTDTARQYLAELVKMDPGYRDARTRLDKLGEISDNF
jgi:tetratricopeptide (TPR) repeat protein